MKPQRGICQMPDTYRLTFPNGSVLKGCRMHYTERFPDMIWFVFMGRQFSIGDVVRWNVKTETEAIA